MTRNCALFVSFIPALTLLSLSACDDRVAQDDRGWIDDEAETEPEVALEGADALMDEPAETRTATFDRCPAERQVAKLTGCSCADVGAWSASPVFSASAPGMLAGYCQYEWADPLTPPDLSVLDNGIAACLASPDDAPASDCNDVRPQADPLTAVASGPLRDEFYAQVERTAGGVPGLSQVPVSVAVLDTHNPANADNPYTGHGHAMRAIITSLMCAAGDASCPSQLFYRLSMPRDRLGELQLGTGGILGSFTDVATTVEEALIQWVQEPGERLVINLSLGWMPTSLQSPETWSPPERAVYDAVRVASCSGALIVAAAGNHSGTMESCTDGPLAPAAWEVLPAPTEPECIALGIPTPPKLGTHRVHAPGTFVGPTPLVHAVSGVDAHNESLSSTQGGSRPRLAAYAFAASADSPSGMTEPVSGSSVAAVVGSSVAATMWTHWPELSAPEVMEFVYQGGTIVPGQTADHPVPVPIHRISACEALQAACSADGSCVSMSCSGLPSTGALGPMFTAIDGAIATAAGAGNLIEVTVLPDATTSVCSGACSGTTTPTHLSGPGATCFDVISESEVLATHPQPGWPVCPSCTLTTDDDDDELDGELPMALGEDYGNQTIVGATLELLTAQNAYERYDLGALPSVTDSTITTVTVESSTWPDDVASASLTLQLQDTANNGPITQHSSSIPVREI